MQYGVLGLDKARELFGDVRLARHLNFFHPSDGLKFTHIKSEEFVILPSPPFLVETDGEFDEYYSGKYWGWD